MANAFSGRLMHRKGYQSFPNFCTYEQKLRLSTCMILKIKQLSNVTQYLKP